MDPILTFFHGRRRKYVLFWYYKITCPAMVFHQFMEKDEDTLFIRYQKKKKNAVCNLALLVDLCRGSNQDRIPPLCKC